MRILRARPSFVSLLPLDDYDLPEIAPLDDVSVRSDLFRLSMNRGEIELA